MARGSLTVRVVWCSVRIVLTGGPHDRHGLREAGGRLPRQHGRAPAAAARRGRGLNQLNLVAFRRIDEGKAAAGCGGHLGVSSSPIPVLEGGDYRDLFFWPPLFFAFNWEIS